MVCIRDRRAGDLLGTGGLDKDNRREDWRQKKRAESFHFIPLFRVPACEISQPLFLIGVSARRTAGQRVAALLVRPLLNGPDTPMCSLNVDVKQYVEGSITSS